MKGERDSLKVESEESEERKRVPKPPVGAFNDRIGPILGALALTTVSPLSHPINDGHLKPFQCKIEYGLQLTKCLLQRGDILFFEEWWYKCGSTSTACLQGGDDHVVGDLASKSQETNVTNVSPSTHLTLGWVTAGVSVAVSHTTKGPDQTQDRGCDGVADTRDQQGEQEGRVTLQCVLVDALLAIEYHLLLVLLGLSLVGIHLRKGDSGNLAVGSDLVAKEPDDNGREDRGGEGLKERRAKPASVSMWCTNVN